MLLKFEICLSVPGGIDTLRISLHFFRKSHKIFSNSPCTILSVLGVSSLNFGPRVGTYCLSPPVALSSIGGYPYYICTGPMLGAGMI